MNYDHYNRFFIKLKYVDKIRSNNNHHVLYIMIPTMLLLNIIFYISIHILYYKLH